MILSARTAASKLSQGWHHDLFDAINPDRVNCDRITARVAGVSATPQKTHSLRTIRPTRSALLPDLIVPDAVGVVPTKPECQARAIKGLPGHDVRHLPRERDRFVTAPRIHRRRPIA